MGLFSRFVAKIKGESTASTFDWEELHSELLASDLGPHLSQSIIDEAKKLPGDAAEDSLKEILRKHLSTKPRALNSGSPRVCVIVGVNGVGKTTSVAKLAASEIAAGSKVILGAADTFRAAAVDQLVTWGARAGVEVVTGKGDSASVAFDTVKRGLEVNANLIVIDTAGRLHTKNDLMQELGKVIRVIEKSVPVTDILLVLDGTTGQNGVAQAKIFGEAVPLTGLIVTKLDGSARGGIALAVEDALDLPIKFIGMGEKIEDFEAFSTVDYIDGLVTHN
jgi:fused signal recognition particle receptor